MTRDGQPIVEFRRIAKTYDGVRNVVADLDLAIGRGEFVTLLGPSGSGKTTLLMLLAGFEVPTAGEILLEGRLLNRVPAFRRNMGVVFQSYALFPHMTVRRNVAYPLVRRGLPKAEIAQRVEAALAMIHMEAFAERLPTQLSGGQQQRVALARALVFRPDVVLMDEPLGALDKKLREEMQLEIKHLHASLGMTVVYVTHDQSEALTMSDRVAVFNEGAILQIGAPDEIYERPNCSFVANFIGEINNFPGRVEAGEGAQCQVALDGGARMAALNVLGAAGGAAVNVAVRPERLRLAAPDAGGQGLSARVAGAIYHGDHLRYELEIDGTRGVMAKVGVEAPRHFAVGDRVLVTWSAEHARALDPREVTG